MKKGGMKSVLSFSSLPVLFLLSQVFVAGCATRPPAVEVTTTDSPRPPQRMWVGERAKVVILEFGNKVPLESSGKRSIIDSVFGNNMKKQLVMGLQQTEQFAVLDPLGAKRALTEQDFTSTGEIKRKTMSKLGPLEGAEFLITGAVTVYQPSRMSINTGIEADPLFSNGGMAGHGVTAATLAQAFASLPVASQDRIAIDLRLIDAATGKAIGATAVEGVPQEFDQQRGGLFDENLTTTFRSLSTPMQKALRVCTIKAVDWIAATGLAHRRQAVLPPTPLPSTEEKPKLIKRPVVEKKSEREKPVREPTVRKQEAIERPMVEKPSAEKLVIEKPVVEKSPPKKEVPRSEEWGQ